MYLNNKEEKIIATFYINIDKYEKNLMILKWDNENQITATFDTCFENDNDFDENAPEYEEYTTFVFKLIEISGTPPVYVTEDRFFCIDYHNFPKEILVDGVKIN